MLDDSVEMTTTDTLKNQMRQLFSPDESLPVYHQVTCQKQVGGTDCGLFAIANAMEVLTGNDVGHVVFDQTMMRKHLATCFENGKIHPFPKYRVNCNSTKSRAKPSNSDSDWKSPRHVASPLMLGGALKANEVSETSVACEAREASF